MEFTVQNILDSPKSVSEGCIYRVCPIILAPSCLFLESPFLYCPQGPVESLPWSKHVCSSSINDCMPQYVFVPFLYRWKVHEKLNYQLMQYYNNCSLLCIVLWVDIWQGQWLIVSESHRISELASLFSCVLGWMCGSIESSAGPLVIDNGGTIY